MQNYDKRSDVEEKYKWDISVYFKSNDEFKKELNDVKKRIDEVSKYVGCTKDTNKLLEYLKLDIDLSIRIMNLEIYAMMLSDSDLNESEPIEFIGYTDELSTNYSVLNAFFEPELLSLSKKDYEALFKDGILDEFKPYLDNLYRYKEHHLNEGEQKIVSTLTQTLGNYSNMSSGLLNNNHNYGKVIMEDGEEVELLSTNYRKIMKGLPREKRKEVYEQFFKVIDQYASTSAGLLNSYVKTQNNKSLIYKFDSAWDLKLFNQKLSNKVYDALVNACVKNKDIINKYENIKAKVLGVDKLMPWDAPMELYKLDKEYSIEEAQDICLKAINVLGTDYIDRFKTLIDNRAVDYCRYKGKCSGGYNVSSLGKKMSHILMSFNGDLDSVSTLIHEGGHYTHHTYIYDNNEPIYRDHSPVICEVASLTNECLLSNYLLENGTKEEALAGLANIIGVIMSNLFGAVQEGDMEREFYNYSLNGGTLTKDYLYDLTEKSKLKFYPDKKLDHEYQKCSWINRSHYYMFFYLFSYAICISVASNISSELLNGNKDMLDRYKKFLSTGSDVNIMDTFKILNIDLEDERVYENAINYFGSLLDQFDKLYEEVSNG